MTYEKEKCWIKAEETESQFTNMAIFNLQSAKLLIEIQDSDFIDERNLEIKKAIAKLLDSGQKPSITSIYNELPDVIMRNGMQSEVRSYYKKLACAQHFGDPYTIMKQFKSSHRMCRLKNGLEILHEIAAKGDTEDFDVAFDTFITQCSSENELDDGQVMADIISNPNPEQVKGKFFDMPIASLREMIPKVRTGQYICIAGAPAAGKTTLGGILAECLPNMFYQSYEMDAEEIRDIIISRNSKINSRKIEFNNMDFEERKLFDTTKRILKDKITMRISDKPYRDNDLFAVIKRMKYKFNINGVVIDYAQIIPRTTGKKSQVEYYEYLSNRFKIIARELNIIVIALSAINNNSLRENRAPNLSDLRGSLSFGADADTVIFLYNDGEDNPSCSVGKQRKGKIGKVYNFKYNKEIHSMY